MATDVEDVVIEPLSLRETLEDAIEEHDVDHEIIPADDSAEKAPVAKAESPATETPAETVPAVPAVETVAPVAAPVATEPAPVVTTDLKAPAQWKPQVREKWNALPREVQEEVLRRESDNMRLIGSVGPKIRLADEVQGYIAPFQARLDAAGVAPQAFLGDVFSSIRTLAEGSPEQRATVVANMVHAYGVDLKTLDAILTQRLNLPPEVMQAQELAVRARQVLDGNARQAEQQTAAEAERAIAAFVADPKHEFIADVRELMADLIDSGRAKTLEDAYSAAIWANPDTRKILLQREAQSLAATKNTRAAVARRASSSVRGSPAVPGTAAAAHESGSLRDAIAAAFDEHSSL